MKALLKRMGWKKILGACVLLGVLGAVGGPYVYIHFIEGTPPAPLTNPGPASQVPQSPASPQAGASGSVSTLDGTWSIAGGSQAGYRVKEVLFGQDNTAVGRTSSIMGQVKIAGPSVTEASFQVDMTTVASDQARRDRQFQGRIMDTADYPASSFKLTQPIAIGSVPASGTQASGRATGDLTLHGTTKQVTFTVNGKIDGGTLRITGQIPITFADWNIPNPTFGPVSTEDHGILEFALNLTHA